MATFIFDGTTSVTAAKTDTVVITASPSAFTQVSESGGNVIFAFGGQTLTITGTTYGPNGTQFPGVSLAGGTFATAAATGTAFATSNVLSIGSVGTITETSSATGTSAFFGGLGVSDASDGNDVISFGGKGSFLAYGNAGDDTFANNTKDGQGVANGAFDSTSFATVFGGKGADIVNFSGTAFNGVTGTDNAGLNAAIFGGEGSDKIAVNNITSGTVTIFGGQGPGDSTDAADTIAFGGGATSTIYGNAGADVITSTITAGQTGASSTIFGGRDSDTITFTGNATKTTATIYGGEAGDQITSGGTSGTTVIFGGTGAGDSADGADTIAFTGGGGTTAIYGNGGADTITVNGGGTATGSVTTIFAGVGNDSINANGFNAGTNGTVVISGNEGSDVFQIGDVAIAATPQSNIGQSVTIADFTVGTDSITVQNGAVAATPAVVAATNNPQTLTQALDAAALSNGAAAGTVSVVAFQGNTYVVVNAANGGGFDAAADLAIKLTGVTDVAGVAAAITTF